MITNNITKKRYIGKSFDLLARVFNYFDDIFLKNHPSLIHKALLNFGHAKFSFSIIEFCNRDELNSKELHYINLLKPQYNIRKPK